MISTLAYISIPLLTEPQLKKQALTSTYARVFFVAIQPLIVSLIDNFEPYI